MNRSNLVIKLLTIVAVSAATCTSAKEYVYQKARWDCPQETGPGSALGLYEAMVNRAHAGTVTREEKEAMLAEISDAHIREWDACEGKFEASPEGLALREQERRRVQREEAQQRELARVRALPGPRIGMTKKQVLERTNWGAPLSVNRLTTAHGTREQWVYGEGNYLYFDNGVLTAIQD